jgi:hypothetical protein
MTAAYTIANNALTKSRAPSFIVPLGPTAKKGLQHGAPLLSLRLKNARLVLLFRAKSTSTEGTFAPPRCLAPAACCPRSSWADIVPPPRHRCATGRSGRLRRSNIIGHGCAARLDEPIGTGWLLVPAVRPFGVLMVGVDGELLRLIAGDDRCRLRR